MKQAIEYNLAGSAKNEPNDAVSFTLQGDAKRLDDAIAAIREGTKKSSNIDVNDTRDSRSEPGRLHDLRLDIDDPEHYQPV